MLSYLETGGAVRSGLNGFRQQLRNGTSSGGKGREMKVKHTGSKLSPACQPLSSAW